MNETQPLPTDAAIINLAAAERTMCTAGTDEECTRRGCATSCPALRASHGQAPAGTATEEIDRALNAYAQAFAARVNGWTRQNGDDFPGARIALFKAIAAYAREISRSSSHPTPSPQAAQQAPAGAWIERWYGSGGKEG